MRFLIGGGTNTLLSYVIYWLLLTFQPYLVAYTLSYLATVLSGYAINTYFVFRSHWSWGRLLAFPVVHLVNYTAGTGVIYVWVQVLDLDARIAPVAATVVTLPLNFFMTRFVIRGPAGRT